MLLKLSYFLLISALMATSVLLGDTVPHATSQIDGGPVAEAQASLPPGLDFLPNNDPTAIELAHFAIDEHNKEAKDALQFSGILETVYANREGGGKSYSLVIAATTNNNQTHIYAAKILDDGGNKKLVAFKQV